MKKILIKHIIIFMIISIFLFCTKDHKKDKIINTTLKFSEKIITLAPALTEIVFALGSGDQIIGNTNFCKYPEEAEDIKKIGGFLDINIEMILKLKPDLIICYPEHKHRLKILNNKIELLEVKHITVSDILSSINTIASKLGKMKNSDKLIRNIKDKLYKKNNFTTPKKVILIADRDPHRLKSMYIIGNKGFLNEILNLSGGTNCYKGNVPYPSVSIESIVSMNPDIIIEFSFIKNIKEKQSNLSEWKKYPMINAVRSKKIFYVTGDFWQKPGPRIVTIAEELKMVIN